MTDIRSWAKRLIDTSSAMLSNQRYWTFLLLNLKVSCGVTCFPSEARSANNVGLPKSASPILGSENSRKTTKGMTSMRAKMYEWRVQKRWCSDDMIFSSPLCAGDHDYSKAYQGIGNTLSIVIAFSSLPDIQISALHSWPGRKALRDDQRSQSRAWEVLVRAGNPGLI